MESKNSKRLFDLIEQYKNTDMDELDIFEMIELLLIEREDSKHLD